MSELRVYGDADPTTSTRITRPAAIAARLAEVGVRFEQWVPRAVLPPQATAEQVLAAYRPEVDRILAESGFEKVDVIGLGPDHPQREAFRAKFLDEHTHAEFEIRFFVEGSGQFNLHLDGRVFSITCTAGDLLSVPAGTPHWFDMGPRPRFRCIRFFTTPEGWVAQHTGSDIATRFPRFDAEAPA